MNTLDIGEVQVDFGNAVAETVTGYFGKEDFLHHAGDDAGAFNELLLEYSHRYVDRVWELEAEFEPHDVEDAAQGVINGLESTTRVSPTVPVYVAEMLVDLAGGQRQVGAYLTKIVKDLWFAHSHNVHPDAQPEPVAQVGGILERIEANQQRIIRLLEEG